MESLVPPRDITYYKELALQRIHDSFPDAGLSCFSSRYITEPGNDGPVFVDNEATWEYPGKWYPQTLHISDEEFISLLVKDGLKPLLNCVVHRGSWSYAGASLKPDIHGCRIAARMVAKSLDEYYEWGIDATGFPYEKHEKTDDAHRSAKRYCKRLTLRDFIQQLNQLGTRLKGSALEMDFREAGSELIRMAKTAFSQNQAGLTAPSAFAAGSVDTKEAGMDKNPVAGRFVVYDLFQEGTDMRTLPHTCGPEIRLEKYAFVRRKDGTVEFEVQKGWFAGSHYDGLANAFTLPSEWFALSWDAFLTRFTEWYPEEQFSYGKRELAVFPGLKHFLGFSNDDRQPGTWFCTQCGMRQRHADGKYCTNCGTKRRDLRVTADNTSAHPHSSVNNAGSMILERDSVCMGDDCYAPHRAAFPYADGCLLSEFMPTLAGYLPPMKYKGWLVCCDAERVAMLYSGGDAKYAWELLVSDRKLSAMPKQYLFCIQCAELQFGQNSQLSDDSARIRQLIAAIRSSEFFHPVHAQ